MSERERRKPEEFDETWDAERYPDPKFPPEVTPVAVSDFKDLKILCVDCGNEFDFTSVDHEFFKEKIGADYKLPRRCAKCRAAKRQRQAGRIL